MRVIGLLSFYDEQADHLTGCVTSLAVHGVDHLVAVDGAYGLFPGPRGFTGRDAHEVIHQAAYDGGMGCTIHTPPGPWEGNEIEKRSFMFRVGHALAEPGVDWLYVHDADETIVHAGDWRSQLEQTSHDVASIEHGEPSVRPRLERRLFRAHPRGISVRLAHYYYLDGDERILWGPGQIDREIVDMRVLHRPLGRTRERNQARNRYYEERLLTIAEREVR